MYLLDTNVISEQRKKSNANLGVKRFFQQASQQNVRGYISVVTLGELRRGVELIRHKGDQDQAQILETWLQTILDDYNEYILDFTAEEAQVWGCLRAPHYQNPLDKQIAATALTHGLILVTRNIDDFVGSSVSLLNPFE